jgi:hypothetical protein
LSRKPRTAAERFEQLKRDQEAYRRISLARRSHARFHRDLRIVPHVFLLAGHTRMAPLAQPLEVVRAALAGKAIWTLDTAARLVTGSGFLTSPDLTGYMTEDFLAQAVVSGLVAQPQVSGLSLTPLYQRPPMLIAHVTEELPAAVELPSGDRVVRWNLLIRDLFGTLGWRPDLLTKLETSQPLWESLEPAPGDGTVAPSPH